ncbi:MAG TPA: lipocalin family protein [Kiritimatiellia bacterium]|nr:lipocalin family protein [Kiritimatiellia bacterium]HMP00477.1 lipocalin family protein [Kiritimatiellia bacterium]HMP97341.1 lipocalin family protein [Kiritimatiellia bacterium]
MNHTLLLLVASLLLVGCATRNPPSTVSYVDLDRFMGDWYVIGGNLTWFERDAYHAIENYRLDEKGRIPTTFTFRRGGFDGPEKTYRSMAFVHDRESNAEWRIQFFWPVRFPYLVVYLDPDYQATAISTDDRKYLWIMSRTPQLREDLRLEIMQTLEEKGFDTSAFVTVPQPESP